MKTQLVAAVALSAMALALTTTDLLAQQQPASEAKGASPKAAATATEDVVYMRDGRVLHGKVLAQTSRGVSFEYHDANLKIKTTLNLAPEDIAEIQRDVPVKGAAPAEADDASADSAADADADVPMPASGKAVDYKPSYGAAKFETNDPNVPSIYIVPMHGQFGTDVRAEVYKPVIEDIKKNKPDMVVLDIRAADSFPPELMHPTGYDMNPVDPALERGMLEFENYRELVHMFRDELSAALPKTRQVVWITDSDGISAVVAMAWPSIYMKSKARFGGLITVLEQSGAASHADSDVRAKMMAAWLGIATSFLEKGGYSGALAAAMLDPTKKLSGSWRGRQVDWMLNSNGEYLVDDSDRHTVDFVAKSAEDFCLSQGTADELDDLALLLNYREYRLIDSRQDDLTLGYVADWRRVFADCQQKLKDYTKHLGWASGDDTLRYLGRAKKDLEDVLKGMNKYKAVEIRLGTDFGLDRVTLITYIEQLGERIRAMQRSGGNRGAGGGRAGSGSGRAGGSGGPGSIQP